MPGRGEESEPSHFQRLYGLLGLRHFIPLTVLLIYSVAGAALFNALEAPSSASLLSLPGAQGMGDGKASGSGGRWPGGRRRPGDRWRSAFGS